MSDAREFFRRKTGDRLARTNLAMLAVRRSIASSGPLEALVALGQR